MRKLSREHSVDELNSNHRPAYTIDEGEQVVVETHDCHGGFVGRDGIMRPDPPGPNPATGPIEIKGSRPGEALAVTIHEVKADDWGFIGGVDEEAGFTVVDIKDGTAIYPWGLRLPISPIVGVIGVAPPGEPVPTTVPSQWGGNLDTVDVCAGATVYLPVAVPGAMLCLGDVHALQGDSECCGTGLECAAEITLSVRRISQPLWPHLYLVREDKLMLFAHSEKLDQAAWEVVADMAKLLTQLTGLSDTQARRLLSTAGEIRICQIVNPKTTCRAIIPREAIPDHWPF